MQQAGTAVHKVDDMEFGRRLAMEREIELPGPDGRIPAMSSNAIWDESGAFVLYPTLIGIKGIVISQECDGSNSYSVSGQYCDKSSSSTTWQRRGSAMAIYQCLPRCTC